MAWAPEAYIEWERVYPQLSEGASGMFGQVTARAEAQVLRLALVPFGHLSGRLPLGNPGRSTVSAFEPLPVRPELAGLIAQARTGETPAA